MRTRPCTGAPRRTDERGFSLVELLVVILIIGVLAAIAIPLLMNQRNKAFDASLKSDLRSVATAMETGRAAGGELPTTAAGLAGEVRTSPGNVIGVVVTGLDYCLSAQRSGSARTWLFDTSDGGLADAEGGTCTGTVDFTLP
jgi:prepilin-type N-terminal cleavage/methylation domain-containing protein